jgi:putative (di)nucleoside polyphosphate hydrolase
MAEEIGTDKAELLAESKNWHRYDLPPDLVPRLWKGRYRGQEQRWFAFRFAGSDDDIDIETENPEFSAWRWASLAELPTIIVPFKRALYMQLVEEFQPVVSKLGAKR